MAVILIAGSVILLASFKNAKVIVTPTIVVHYTDGDETSLPWPTELYWLETGNKHDVPWDAIWDAIDNF